MIDILKDKESVHGPRKVKKPRAAASYRSARRNEVKRIRGVWKSAVTPTYQPATASGTSALRVNGKTFPERRMPARTYKANYADRKRAA